MYPHFHSSVSFLYLQIYISYTSKQIKRGLGVLVSAGSGGPDIMKDYSGIGEPCRKVSKFSTGLWVGDECNGTYVWI